MQLSFKFDFSDLNAPKQKRNPPCKTAFRRALKKFQPTKNNKEKRFGK